jgi:hypothetical protein
VGFGTECCVGEQSVQGMVQVVINGTECCVGEQNVQGMVQVVINGTLLNIKSPHCL